MSAIEDGRRNLAIHLGMDEEMPLPAIEANFLLDSDSHFFPAGSKEEVWQTLLEDHGIAPEGHVEHTVFEASKPGFTFWTDFGDIQMTEPEPEGKITYKDNEILIEKF